jgi:hypothetical protein
MNMPHLVDQLSDESLEDAWKVLQALYYDLYMLKAIQEAKQNLQPGDSLSREETLLLLHLP